MPCFTKREVPVSVTVAFTAENEKILIDGLFADGFNVNTATNGLYVNKGARRATIDLAQGTMTVLEGDQSIINEIKRAYSGEVVRQAAKRFAWTLQPTKQANVMVAKRRF
jgi:hypothetical protein